MALRNQCVQYPCLISSCDLFKYDKNEKTGDSKWISQKLGGSKRSASFVIINALILHGLCSVTTANDKIFGFLKVHSNSYDRSFIHLSYQAFTNVSI